MVCNGKMVLHINSVNYGSTGKIAKTLCRVSINKGLESLLCVPKSRTNMIHHDEYDICFGSIFTRRFSSFFERITGLQECLNFYNTLSLIKVIKRYNPALIHFHNLHGSYVNIRILANFLNKRRTPIIWTFHDCWPFTGRCPHFSMMGCSNWISGCNNCHFCKNDYPVSAIKLEKFLWKRKKRLFSSFSSLSICTPSKWLAELVKKSFFGNREIMVINNGINLDIFKPKNTSFRDINSLKGQFLVLGIAFEWGTKKGLDVFIELSKKLSPEYKIVLVGTNESIDNTLPSGILSIHKTSDVNELVDIYNAADVFFNPTREEVFGLVNIEALACGLPVITFNSGGSPECIDSKTGYVITNEDIDASIKAIKLVCEYKTINKTDCIERAKVFDQRIVFDKYIGLYKKLLNDEY